MLVGIKRGLSVLAIVGAVALALWLSTMASLARGAARELPASAGPHGIIPGAEALALRASGAPAGVVLLHGFGDTPQTLASLARALFAGGFNVMCRCCPDTVAR